MEHNSLYLAAALITIAGLDAYYNSIWGRSKRPYDHWWWKWHIAKWISFNGLAAVVVVQNFDMVYWPFIGVLGLVAWKLVAKASKASWLR